MLNKSQSFLIEAKQSRNGRSITFIFFWPSGLGKKTTLAGVLAGEMGSSFIQPLAPQLSEQEIYL